MPSKDASTLRRVAWLALRAAALAVLALAALYLVGINVLLRTSLLRRTVTDGPDKLLLEYSAAYSILPGKVHVEGLSLRNQNIGYGPNATLASDVHGSGTGSGRGDAEVRADSLGFKIGDQILHGTATASVSARGPLNALDLSNTTLSFRGDDSGWWADGRLPRATVSLGPAPSANLSFVANARDGSPVVSAAAKASSVPRWIMNLVPLSALSVAGDLAASPTLIELPSVRAESRGATVEFCYAKGPRPADGKWALLVETGIFHVGVYGDGAAGLVPVDARPWFERESAVIRAAAESSPPAHRLR